MACELDVRVVPRAARPGVAGMRDRQVLVRLGAAPVDGAANAELVETLAGALGLPRRALTIISGATSRRKRIRVEGLSRDAALQKLGVAS